MTNALTLKQYFDQRARRQGIQVKTYKVLDPDAYFHRFRYLPFWIKDPDAHRKEFEAKKRYSIDGKVGCCFWHKIGLPEKEGRGKLPMFDYEWDLNQAIEQKKYVWLKKSAGLGISTFMLYYIAYKSITSDLWKGKQVVVITGPRIDLAVTLIQRLKALFPVNVLPPTKETVCELAGTHVEAFPSHNLDAARGLEKPICIWLDEGDYFPPSEQDEARTISERYIGKSPGMSIILTSTPNKPEGLYETIEKLPADQCLYHRMVMTYEIGLGKIYTPEEIAKARESPSFPREYMGQYIGSQGNVFTHESIEYALQSGLEVSNDYSVDLIPQDTDKSMGIDAGFGSSKFGIVITQFIPANRHKGIKEMIQVIYAEEFERPDFASMIEKIVKLYRHAVVSKIYVDAANPEIITTIKAALNEQTDYERQIANLKQRHPKHLRLSTFMNVIPMSFGTDGREMLAHTKMAMDNHWLAIHPKFHKLIVALRTAVSTDGLLDKASTSHDDILDAFRLSLQMYHSTTNAQQ